MRVCLALSVFSIILLTNGGKSNPTTSTAPKDHLQEKAKGRESAVGTTTTSQSTIKEEDREKSVERRRRAVKRWGMNPRGKRVDPYGSNIGMERYRYPMMKKYDDQELFEAAAQLAEDGGQPEDIGTGYHRRQPAEIPTGGKKEEKQMQLLGFLFEHYLRELAQEEADENSRNRLFQQVMQKKEDVPMAMFRERIPDDIETERRAAYRSPFRERWSDEDMELTEEMVELIDEMWRKQQEKERLREEEDEEIEEGVQFLEKRYLLPPAIRPGKWSGPPLDGDRLQKRMADDDQYDDDLLERTQDEEDDMMESEEKRRKREGDSWFPALANIPKKSKRTGPGGIKKRFAMFSPALPLNAAALSHSHRNRPSKFLKRKRTEPRVERELASIFNQESEKNVESNMTEKKKKKAVDKKTEHKKAVEVTTTEVPKQVPSHKDEVEKKESSKKKRIQKKNVDWSDYFGYDVYDKREDKPARRDAKDKQAFLKSMAKAYIVRKRSPSFEIDQGDDILKSNMDKMAGKIRNMEDTLIDQTVKYTGANIGDPDQMDAVRAEVMEKLKAAYDLEQMNDALEMLKTKIDHIQEELTTENNQSRHNRTDKENEIDTGNGFNVAQLEDSMSVGKRGEMCPLFSRFKHICNGLTQQTESTHNTFIENECIQYHVCGTCGDILSGSSMATCEYYYFEDVDDFCGADWSCRHELAQYLEPIQRTSAELKMSPWQRKSSCNKEKACLQRRHEED